ncbi:hypothetical protein PLICRDRAFT_103105 [Plicaturopsis crispa FD-325 SS-3]|nr:hypothetical protein PLICRDRAFT_103105 [Plicaturopsis crispa FD-325 SS-3]
MSNNLTVLTQSHKAIAAKKRAKRDQIKEVLFDEDARREFLTGFHKRKLAKKEGAKQRAIEREKQERLEARREQRQMLREQAIQNAKEVESAYGALVSGIDDDDEEWAGISDKGKGKQREQEQEEEYEDEEQLATVTVVEDFDPHTILHGPASSVPSARPPSTKPPGRARTHDAEPKRTRDADLTRPTTKRAPRKSTSYQTKAERKADSFKQRARRTEKAELAGGKASRGKVVRPRGGKGHARGQGKAKGKGARGKGGNGDKRKR